MSHIVIDEKCACGAELHWRGDSVFASRATRDWRFDHRHIEPPAVGICGEKAEPLVMAGGEIDQMWCEIPAGHLGAHGNGDGRHWIKAGPNPPAPEASAGVGEGVGS